jgi:3',5'-cyclic AMP phosphodiesterase CpdA
LSPAFLAIAAAGYGALYFGASAGGAGPEAAARVLPGGPVFAALLIWLAALVAADVAAWVSVCFCVCLLAFRGSGQWEWELETLSLSEHPQTSKITNKQHNQNNNNNKRSARLASSGCSSPGCC